MGNSGSRRQERLHYIGSTGAGDHRNRAPAQAKVIHFQSFRTLRGGNVERVRGPLLTMLKGWGVSSMSLNSGEVFGLMVGERAVGGLYIRTWPGFPAEGDLHVWAARSRFKDINTIRALDLFLTGRASIMNIRKWRVIVEAHNSMVIAALRLIGFHQVGRQAFPGIPDGIILEREV